MSIQAPISPTYYVLCNVSTCPVAVPLQDYCRQYKKDSELIKETWKVLRQSKGKDNEQIIICYDPEKWSYVNN